MKKILIPALLFSVLCRAQKVSLTLGGDYSRGNINIANVDFRSEIKQDSGKIVWAVSPTYRFTYLIKDKRILNNETYVAISAETYKGKWKFLMLSENEKSENRKILYRGNLGLGVSYHFIENEKIKLVLSEVLLPEIFYSEISGQRKALRLSSRVKFLWKSGILSFSSTSVIQPSIINSPTILAKDNFIMRSQNYFEIHANKKISLVIGADIIVQTYPAAFNEKEAVDYRYYTSLKFKL